VERIASNGLVFRIQKLWATIYGIRSFLGSRRLPLPTSGHDAPACASSRLQNKPTALGSRESSYCSDSSGRSGEQESDEQPGRVVVLGDSARVILRYIRIIARSFRCTLNQSTRKYNPFPIRSSLFVLGLMMPRYRCFPSYEAHEALLCPSEAPPASTDTCS